MLLRTTLLSACVLAAGLTAPAHAVVGGNDASPGEYPYVAHISIDRAFQCTGTLVTPTHVVTAGHCTSIAAPTQVAAVPLGQPGQLVELTIGAHKTPQPYIDAGYNGESDGEEHVAKKVSVAPGYLGVRSVSSDVAVIELARPSAKTPVKIAGPGERSLWTAGTMATIAGFGVTESGGDSPDVLQEARVPIVADSVAAEAYPYLIDGVDALFGGFESDTQLGAGYPEGGVDTCQGDSGGPLLVPAPSGGFRLVGDTSYGAACAEPGYPGIYGRIADTTLRTWIASVAPGSVSGGTTTTSTSTTGTKPSKTSTTTSGSGSKTRSLR
jgi:trypsin